MTKNIQSFKILFECKNYTVVKNSTDVGVIDIINLVKSLISKFYKLSSMKIILLGYCAIIIIGALLLTLPFSAKSGQSTPFIDSLFTSTSAACVTGLIRFDTFSHWTLFGQIVILCLIQTGGIGYMTLAITFVTFTKKKIGLTSRFILQDSIASPQVGGVVRMTKFIVLGSLAMELVGAVLLAFYFCPATGFVNGIYYSVFHAISAFCNAGFDLMGQFGPFTSLTEFSGNWYVCSVIMALVTAGGLGFFVWYDILSQKFRFSKFKLQTKLVLTVSGILVVSGAVFIWLFELKDPNMAERPVNEQILCSLFQSVTARTAGFNTINIVGMTDLSKVIMMFLMLVGGSTGSTAGGMKTTTLAVLVLSVASTFRRRKSTEVFGRRLEDGIMMTSCCIFMLYIFLAFTAGIIISAAEDVPFTDCMFESISAVGTVGITLGITPTAGIVSETVLILLMLFGRVGSITMLLAFASEKSTVPSKLPLEKIQVG